MYVVSVELEVRAEALEAFLLHMRTNATASVAREPGCFTFDVSQGENNPTHVLLYEVYSDRAAFDLHLASGHFTAFDAATREMILTKTIKCWTRLPSGSPQS